MATGSWPKWMRRAVKVAGGTIFLIAAMTTIYIGVKGMTGGQTKTLQYQLIFTDYKGQPRRHCRVCITGSNASLSTTSDGDISIEVEKKASRITGVIYCPQPIPFDVNLDKSVRQIIIQI